MISSFRLSGRVVRNRRTKPFRRGIAAERLEARQLLAAAILDDSSAAFSTTGAWVSISGGHEDGSKQAATASPSQVAQWAFKDLAPGLYQPAAHWFSDSLNSSQASFELFDGGLQIAALNVNQQLPPQNDLGAFEFLGRPIIIESGELTVRLRGDDQGLVSADAIKLEPLSTSLQTLDDVKLPDARLRLTNAAGAHAESTLLPMTGQLLLRKADTNPLLLELTHNNDLVASIAVASESELITIDVDRYEANSDPIGPADHTLTFSATANQTTIFSFNSARLDDQEVRLLQDSVDALNRQHATAPTAELERQISTAVMHLAVADYFHELNQTANVLLGSSTGLTGMLAVATSSGTWVSHSGGEFGFVPSQPRLLVTTPAITTASFRTLTADTLHEFGLRDAAIRRRVIEAVGHAQSRSFGRVLQNATSSNIPVARLVSRPEGGYLNLISGSVITNIASWLGLSSLQETWLARRIDDGFMVTVPRNPTAFAGLNNAGYLATKLHANGTATWESGYFYDSTAASKAEAFVPSVAPMSIAPLDQGDVKRSDTDLQLPSIGIPVDITRHYDSAYQSEQGFGPGWGFSYGSFLETTTGTNSVVWHRADGRRVVLGGGVSTGDLTVYSTSSIHDGSVATKVVTNGIAYYTVTTRHGDRYSFGPQSADRARLVELRDRNGNVHQVTYNADGIESLVDLSVPSSPQVRLTFNVVDGHIQSVNDDVGRTWSYQYATGPDGISRLSKVIRPSDAMCPPIDPTYTYGSGLGDTGLLVSAQTAGQPLTLYRYSLSGRLRATTDETNRVKFHRYDDFGRSSVATSPSGRITNNFYDATHSDQTHTYRTFDAATNRLTGSRTEAAGRSTYLQYDEKGNLIRQSTDDTETNYAYDDAFNQLVSITTRRLPPPIKPSLLVSQYTPPVQIDDEPVLVHTNELDSRGNVIAHTNAAGQTTRRTYTDRGLLQSETSPSGVQTDDIGDYQTWFIYNDYGQLTERITPSADQQVDTTALSLTGTYPGNARIRWFTNDPTLADVEDTGTTETTLSTNATGPSQTVSVDAWVFVDQPATSLTLVSSSPFDKEDLTFAPEYLYSGYGYQQPYRNPENVALGASVTATNSFGGTYYVADKLVDGKYGYGSSYIAGAYTASIIVELPSVENVDRLTFGQDRVAGFNDRQLVSFSIDASLDGVNYTTVFDSKKMVSSQVNLPNIAHSYTVEAAFPATDAKFVRFNGYRPASAMFQLDEIEIFRSSNATGSPSTPAILDGPLTGVADLRIITASPIDPSQLGYAPGYSGTNGHRQPYANPHNVALGATVTATSQYDTFHNAQNLTDGLYGNGSVFIAGTSNTGVVIELAQLEKIDRLQFGSERIYGYNDRLVTEFAIEVSIDGENYLRIFDSKDVVNASARLASLPPRSTVQATFQPVNAKYVRFFSPTSGYRIDEIEILAAVAEGQTSPARSEVQYVTSSVFDPAQMSYVTGYQNNWLGERQPFHNPRNVALGAAVSATNQQTDGPFYRAEFLTDGHYGHGSLYYAAEASASITIELDSAEIIDELRFGSMRATANTNHQVLEYSIEVSTDGVSYSKVFDSKHHINGSVNTYVPVGRSTISASFPPVEASYVRFNGTRAVGYRFTIDEIEIMRPMMVSDDSYELSLAASSPFDKEDLTYAPEYLYSGYGNQQPYRNPENVALGASVTATNSFGGTYYVADKLVDGKYGYGSSYIAGAYAASIIVELPSVENVDRLTFGQDRVAGFNDRQLVSFSIDASLDGVNYTTVFDSKKMVSSQVNLPSIAHSYTVQAAFPSTDAKFVRFNGERIATAKFQLDEIEIFRSSNATVPPATPSILDGPLTGLADLQIVTASPIDPGQLGYAPGYSGADGYRQPYSNPLNVALGATVTATTQHSTFYNVQNLTDGHYGNGSAFVAGSSNTGVVIELAQLEKIDRLQFSNERIHGYNNLQVTEFTIEVSIDGKNYLRIFDSKDVVNAAARLGSLPPRSTIEATFQPVNAKYVRFFSPTSGYRIDEIEILAAVAEGQTSPARSEVQYVTSSVFDPAQMSYVTGYQNNWLGERQPFHNPRNVALGAAVSVTNQHTDGPFYRAEFLTDGHYGHGSLYYAAEASASITIELDSAEIIDELRFGSMRATANTNHQVLEYSIEVSTDGISYSKIFDSKHHINGSVNTYVPVGRSTISASFPPVEASYVRFNGTRAVGYRFTIDEIEIMRAAYLETFEVSTAPSLTDSVPRERFTYDNRYQLVIVTDATGIQTRYEYDDNGKVTTVVMPDPYAGTDDSIGEMVSTVTYNEYGDVQTQIDSLGKVTTFQRDAVGRILSSSVTDASTTPPTALTTIYSYDADGNLTSVTDPSGAITRIRYDGAGRPITTILPDGSFTSLAYNSAGQLVSQTDAAGAQTNFHYDVLGRLAASTHPNGGQTTYAYDLLGRLASQTGPLGGAVTYAYDSAGQVSRRTTSDQLVETFDYDANGNLVTVGMFDVSGMLAENIPDDLSFLPADRQRISNVSYDANRQPVSWIDPIGGIREVQRDAQGRVLSQNDAGRTVQFEYDLAGRLRQSMTLMDGADKWVQRQTLDAFGRTIESSHGVASAGMPNPILQSQGQAAFDAFGGISALTDALGQVTQITQDPVSRITTVTRPGGAVVTTVADAVGRTLTTTLESSNLADPFLPRQTENVYDASGQLSGYIDPHGNLTQWVRDALGNVIEAISPETAVGGSTIRMSQTFQYDAVGNIIAATDAAGRTTTYQYDSLGRLLHKSLPDPDAEGPLSAPSITYSYNGFGDLVSTTDHLGRQTSFAYDSLGRRIATTTPDPDGEGPLSVATTTYTYDDAGNLTASTDSSGRAITWQYDSLGRVISERLPDPDMNDARPAPEIRYTYNDSGNLSSVTDVLGAVTELEYDALGREILRRLPAAVSGGPRPTITRSYDAAGNVASVTDPLGATTQMTYDVAGQLLNVMLPDPDPTDQIPAPIRTYVYDVGGNLISFTDLGGETTSIDYDAVGRPVSQTVSDPDGSGPLSEFTISWLYDAVGNVLRQEDSVGRVTGFVYDNLGREILRSLPAPDPALPDNLPTIVTAYDDAGQIASVTDPIGNQIQYLYDAWGRLTFQSTPFAAGAAPSADGTSFSYDDAGNLATFTDTLGRTTSLAYDALGRLTFIALPVAAGSPPSNVGTSLTYDDAGNVTAETDPLGRVTLYVRDHRGRLVETVLPNLDPLGQSPPASLSMQYDDAGQLIATTDPLGRQTNYQYDVLGRTIFVSHPFLVGEQPSGLGTSYSYDAAGNLTELVDALGRTTTWVYDAWGREINRILPDPDGAGPLPAPVISTQYDSFGNAQRMTDQLGRETVYVHDQLGRLLTTMYPDPAGIDPAINGTSYTYDLAGNVTAATDPVGRTVQYQYDAAGRLVFQSIPMLVDASSAGLGTAFVYDSVGNLVSTSDPDGRSTRYWYDAEDRLTFASQLGSTSLTPTGPGTSYAYDGIGNLTSVAIAIDATNELTTSYSYDNWNRKVGVISPTGDATTYEYDAQNNLTRLIDLSGNATTYLYDVFDQVTSVSNALADARTYSYDAVGNLTASTDRNGRQITYTYDALDRLLSEIWLTGVAIDNTITIGYDAAGNLASIADNHVTDTYSYDAMDRLRVHERTGTGLIPQATFSYEYDDAGSLTSVAQTIGSDTITTSYSLDDAGRLAEITQTGGSITDKRIHYTRDVSGNSTRVERFTDPAAVTPVVTTDFSLDSAARRAGIVHRDGATTLASYQYTFDDASRTTSILSLTDGLITLVLDDSGRLTAAVHTVIPDESFSYDATGNRTGAGIVTGVNNQLLSDGTYQYQYDAEGNRIRRTVLVDGQPTGAYTTYQYDHRNRLTEVRDFDAADNPTASVSYTYDPNDQRISRVVDTNGDGTVDQTQRFVVDGATVTAVLDAAGNPTNHYLHGEAVDEVLADESAGGDVLWPLADDQNTIRDLAIAQAGATTVANHRVYDSFGNLFSQTNAAVDHLFGYTGREHDPATGLEYYRARWYDAGVGRFLGEDPIGFAGGDLNLTIYVGNSPYDYTDPSGHSWLSKIFSKVGKELERTWDNVGDGLETTWDFVEENPLLVLGAIAGAAVGYYGGLPLLIGALGAGGTAGGGLSVTIATVTGSGAAGAAGGGVAGGLLGASIDGAIKSGSKRGTGATSPGPEPSQAQQDPSVLLVDLSLEFSSLSWPDTHNTYADPFSFYLPADLFQPVFNSGADASSLSPSNIKTPGSVSGTSAAFPSTYTLGTAMGGPTAASAGQPTHSSLGTHNTYEDPLFLFYVPADLFEPVYVVADDVSPALPSEQKTHGSASGTSSGIPSTFTADATMGSPGRAAAGAFFKEFGYQLANAIADEIPWFGSMKGFAELTTGKDARLNDIGMWGRAGGALNMIPGGGLAGKAVGGLSAGAKGAFGAAAGFFGKIRHVADDAGDVAKAVTTPTGLAGNPMYRHALQPFKGQAATVAGRALTKHPNIAGVNAAPDRVMKALIDEFENQQGINKAAADALKNIMRSGTRTTKPHPDFGSVVDFKLPNGLGARFNAVTNEFIGFLGRGL